MHRGGRRAYGEDMKQPLAAAVDTRSMSKLFALILALTALPAAGCWNRNPFESHGSCGAAVRVLGASGHRVTLEIANIQDDTIEVGASPQASFVDAHGAVMAADMRPGEDDWFMPFNLPARSHRQVTIWLTGGDPGALDRIEIPNSGDGFVPTCTIQLSGLAAER